MSDAARDADAIIAEEQRVGDSRLEAPAGSDLQHYMESTSRLRAEVESLRRQVIAQGRARLRILERAEAAEATMREVAEELRASYERHDLYHAAHRLADRLDPTLVVEKPLHAYFPSDVNAGSRSPCVHCGQFLEAHIPPPVVENPPNTS